MAKPKNKKELLSASQANFQQLLDLINSYPPETVDANFPKGTLNRNIGDVLCHLHHWHLLLLEWREAGMKGKKPDMPAKGFTWQTTPALNKVIWEQYKDTDTKKAIKLLKKSYAKVQFIMHKHTNKELFEKKRYAWTGSTSLGAYLIMNASSHYVWAYKLIKKAKKNQSRIRIKA